jgi:hypothetical protein
MSMAGLAKRLGEKAFNGRAEAVAGAVNGFAGGQAAAFQAIRERIDVVDMVLDIRDARVLSILCITSHYIIIVSISILRFNLSDPEYDFSYY